MIRPFAFAAAALAAAPAWAGPVADAANAAMDRGHGAMCSLAMEPTRVDPYYPCIDFGPYRVVREYGRTSGFVAVRGGAPVRVMVSDGEGERFLAPGPWVDDMAVRLVSEIARLEAPPTADDPVDRADAFVRAGMPPPPAPLPDAAAPAAPPAATTASATPAVPAAPSLPVTAPVPSRAHDPAAAPGDLPAVLGAIAGTSR